MGVFVHSLGCVLRDRRFSREMWLVGGCVTPESSGLMPSVAILRSKYVIRKSLQNLLVTGLLASPACAVDYFVNPTGTYPTIQSAINIAAAGDRVLIEDTGAPTAYFEDINFLGKDIIVRSAPANAFEVTIVGTGTGPVVTITSGEPITAKLYGLRVTGGAAFAGGGILIEKSGATIQDVVVERCIGDFGAGVAVLRGQADLYNLGLEANNEPSLGYYGMYGGGIFSDLSRVSWKGGYVNDNRARVGGGLTAYRSQLRVTDVRFMYNDSDYGGGACLLSSKFPYTFEHCAFLANNAQNIASSGASLGGGMLVAGANVQINDSSFESNMSFDGPGGGLAILKRSQVSIDSSWIVESFALRGGGIYNTGALKIYRTELAGNIAATNGGGIQVERPDSYFAAFGSTIAHNTAGMGGGIALEDYASMDLSLTEILDNGADMGAGIYATGRNGTRFMQSCFVYGNQAGGDGGGLLIRFNAPFTIAGQSFVEQNIAANEGGGIFAYRANLLFESSRCCFNTAGGLGGGLRSVACSPTIQSSVISNNTASDVDGLIVNIGSSIGGGC